MPAAPSQLLTGGRFQLTALSVRALSVSSARLPDGVAPSIVREISSESVDPIIVEAPTKAKALRDFLGPGYRVMATMGHIRDLPPKELGADVEQEFRPTYWYRRGGRKVAGRIGEEEPAT